MEVFKIERSILSKLNAIRSDIQSNLNNYDLNQVNELLTTLERKIKLCIKISEDLLVFFKSRSNFRIIADLKTFSSKKLNHKVKNTKRVDIEVELAKVSTSRNFDKKKLLNLLGKPEQTTNKIVKKAAPKKPQITKIKDQTSRWLGLTASELSSELNELNKYPDAKALKQAATSILKSNEKRFRKREKIIDTILTRISEEKALVHLGR